MSRKKPTKKAQPSQGSVLSRLVKQPLLRTKVDECLDTGVSYDDIVELCAEYEFEISKASISRYKDKREEATKQGIPIEEIIDGRLKNKIISINKKEVVTPIGPKPEDTSPEAESYRNLDGDVKLFNDIEMLDEIILKSFKSLKYVDALDPVMGMKAMELKKKITGDSLQGMTIAGLKELNLRNMALQNQLTEVIAKFIPEDKQEEALDFMEQVEKDFYDNLDLTEEQRRLTKVFEQAKSMGGN